MTATMFQRTLPVLDCADFPRSIPFYRDKLGFAVKTWGEPVSFAILQRGMATIALAAPAAKGAAVSGNWACYVYVRDVNTLYAELLANGVTAHDPPSDQPYNCRDFVVADPDGHMISFGQVLAPDPLGPGLGGDIGRDTNSGRSS
jgi:catechol 2,3-dioxygenase-like lactoylglutathione lyase family enzyme